MTFDEWYVAYGYTLHMTDKEMYELYLKQEEE